MPANNERANFIEDTGLLFENTGLTRMAGRIMGLLMVGDKEMISFDEMTQVLQASKSSISTNLKSLITIHFVRPCSLPGDRKTYYMLSTELDWSDYFQQKMEMTDHLNMLFKRALQLRVNKSDKAAKWLKEATEFYDWLNGNFPKLLEQYTEYKNNQSR